MTVRVTAAGSRTQTDGVPRDQLAAPDWWLQGKRIVAVGDAEDASTVGTRAGSPNASVS